MKFLATISLCLYYWAYLFTPFWGNTPSRAVAVFRLSLAVFYLTAFSLIFFSLKNNKSKIALSLWIIIFSLFFTLYHGNLILSETFSSIAIFSIFWLTAPVILRWENYDFKKVANSVLFSFTGFWTQPLLFFLFLIPFILVPKDKKLKIFFLILGVNLLPLIYFFFTGQLRHFVEQAVWFNLKVYPKYYHDLEISYSDSPILQTISCFIRNEYFLLTHFSNIHQLLQFSLHLSFLVLLVLVIKIKRIKYLAVFLLIFMASRSREVKIIPGQIFNFGIFPFLSIASAAYSLLMIIILKKRKIIAFLFSGFIILLAFLCSKPIISQSLEPGYNYHVFWSYRQNDGETVKSLSKPEENILIYPHDVDLYFFAQRQSIDRFLYWFPWINSVDTYRNERIKALEEKPPSVIYIGSLNFKDNPNYYSQFFPNLLKNYQRVYKNGKETNIWIRKDLVNRIHSLSTAP